MREPELLFADGNTHPDPKVGIPLYGPRSLGTTRHKKEIQVGFIGTAESVSHAQDFIAECCEGVAGDEDTAPFPGFKLDRGFYSEILTDSKIVEPITRQESLDILSIRRSRLRFETLLELLEDKLRLLNRKDHPLDYTFLVLSKELYKECRVTDYFEKGLGPVHRDLRRAFKSLAMQFYQPTQILQETTTAGVSSRSRQLDHKAKIAWNLMTGLYFKVEGLPWGPTGLAPDSCFIGISFFRPLGEASLLRASVVQAFDENGDGLILRGQDFQWDETKDGKSPHLTEELAGELIQRVLEKYEEERGVLPQRVVVHKTSRYNPPEQTGFEKALKKVNQYDLLSLSPSSDVRLLRLGKYPPLRGTALNVGTVSYLYTNGYIPLLGEYPHGHVPSPLQITDHVGDTSLKQLLHESLVLTKMNWNSAEFSGLLPITLRFSHLVGDILREVPKDRDPEPKYKFYM
ncbi:MAG: hypothetical protein AABN95_03340 [Acidobacteriota bacterium]